MEVLAFTYQRDYYSGSESQDSEWDEDGADGRSGFIQYGYANKGWERKSAHEQNIFSSVQVREGTCIQTASISAYKFATSTEYGISALVTGIRTNLRLGTGIWTKIRRENEIRYPLPPFRTPFFRCAFFLSIYNPKRSVTGSARLSRSLNKKIAVKSPHKPKSS